ncbi:MAG: N-succinylarginine dihydrolase [Myxococcota bacterium]
MELNLDGLVGPSHNYGGLSFGNLASQANEGSISNPKQAVLQGLDKMHQLRELGVPQAVLPPHMRPDLELARRLGFGGSEADILHRLAQEAPLLLAACYSAASMWTANAATVTPSVDAADGKLHFTPANLQNKVHRCIEPPTTGRILQRAFPGPRFVHHDPLPATAALGDEGAANHTRFATRFDGPGLHFFVYGESAVDPWGAKPKVFPARQTKEASEAVARLHRLSARQVVFAQQNPDVIDQGVFHNDVICVGHLDVALVHEKAFLDQEKVLGTLRGAFEDLTGQNLRLIIVPEREVSVSDAVSSYLFNSQLVSLGSGRIALVAPVECRDHSRVRGFIDRMIAERAGVDEVHFVDLRQSMQGGGGPACLRLRVALGPEEREEMNAGVIFTPELEGRLRAWVEDHYRDQLSLADLADPHFVSECRTCLDELTQLLSLGSVYAFQR